MQSLGAVPDHLPTVFSVSPRLSMIASLTAAAQRRRAGRSGDAATRVKGPPSSPGDSQAPYVGNITSTKARVRNCNRDHRVKDRNVRSGLSARLISQADYKVVRRRTRQNAAQYCSFRLSRRVSAPVHRRRKARRTWIKVVIHLDLSGAACPDKSTASTVFLLIKLACVSVSLGVFLPSAASTARWTASSAIVTGWLATVA